MKIKKKYKYLICDSIKAYNHFKKQIDNINVSGSAY